LAQLGHVLAGVVILLKSSIVGEHHPALGRVFLVLGIVFILVALFHHKIEEKLPLVAERCLFVLESLALGIVAFEMTAEHKQYLQYAYGFASLVYLVLAAALPRIRQRRQDHLAVRS